MSIHNQYWEDVTFPFSAESDKMLELEMMIKEEKKVIEIQKDVIQDQRKPIEKHVNYK